MIVKNRGFELLSANAIMPKRGTKRSAGYDLYATCDVLIKAHSMAKVVTDVCAYMNDDEYLAIFIRSSLAIKYGLSLANSVGIIDSDYYHNPDNNGNIIVAIMNNTDVDYTIKKGDRIAQGIFMKYLLADNDSAENDRLGGIGSTQK